MNDLNMSFFGIRRGGQHAIINWIAGHFDEPVWFVNDLDDFGNPSPIPCDTGETDLSCFVDDPVRCPDLWTTPKKVFFQSYEDRDFRNLDFEGNERVVGTSDKKKYVLILRDPFNTVASRICNAGPAFVITEKWSVMWKRYAREALGQTSHLPGCIFANYNLWFRSPGYRRRLERKMGLPESDKGIDWVSGVGSSFNKRKFDGKARAMSVEDRWKECWQNRHYRHIFSDPEIWELSDRLFGPGIAERIRPKAKVTRSKKGSLKDKRLVYIRTPKTASTTLKEILSQMADRDGRKVLYRFHHQIHECTGKFDLSLHHVIFNEPNVEKLRQLLPGCRFITSVRDPLCRARSHYNHIGPNGHVNKFAGKGVPFPEWYMKHKDSEGESAGWKNPVLLRHFTNGVMGNFMGFRNPDVTYGEFARRFAFVSVAEQFELSLKVLEALLDTTLDRVDSLRVSSYEKPDVPQEVADAFRDRNTVDYMLYDYGCRRLNEQAREMHCE